MEQIAHVRNRMKFILQFHVVVVVVDVADNTQRRQREINFFFGLLFADGPNDARLVEFHSFRS